jgi:hypothetical protein
MASFDKVETGEKLREMILSVFDIELPVDGGWGYEEKDPTVIYEGEIPTTQLEHTLASMRAHLEMGLMPSKEERYGSINLNETERKEYQKDNNLFHKVSYTITAMKESEYNAFIEEYKEGYGKDSFDIDAHFRKRKEATLTREENFWFRIDQG